MREELHCSDLPKSCLKDILSLPESYWVTSKPWNSCELKAFQKLWRRISDTQKRDISRLRLAVQKADTSNRWLVHEVPLTKIRGNLKDKNVAYTFFWAFVLYISSRYDIDDLDIVSPLLLHVMTFVTKKETYFLDFESFQRENLHSLLRSQTGISACSTKAKTLNEQLETWIFLWSDGCQVCSLNASFFDTHPTL